MGERSAKALADHAADIMPSKVKRLKSPEKLSTLLDQPVSLNVGLFLGPLGSF